MAEAFRNREGSHFVPEFGRSRLQVKGRWVVDDRFNAVSPEMRLQRVAIVCLYEVGLVCVELTISLCGNDHPVAQHFAVPLGQSTPFGDPRIETAELDSEQGGLHLI